MASDVYPVIGRVQLTVQGFPVHRTGYISKTNQTRCDMIAWKKAGEELPDTWLRLLIARYLELFYIKRLDGHPDGANLPIVAESWVEDIGYNLTEEVDSERLLAGFRLLSRSIKKWPQPAELLNCLPGRHSAPLRNNDPSAERSRSQTDPALATAALDKILESLG